MSMDRCACGTLVDTDDGECYGEDGNLPATCSACLDKLDTRAVVTANDRPPVPTRQFDWSATFDDYEPGDVVGYGPTEAEAIADLREHA